MERIRKQMKCKLIANSLIQGLLSHVCMVFFFIFSALHLRYRAWCTFFAVEMGVLFNLYLLHKDHLDLSNLWSGHDLFVLFINAILIYLV